MGNIGDSISDSAPAVGTSGPGYATTINSLLTELKARLIARIPLSSLLTNDDLDLNGQALLNAAYVTLVNEAVSPVASPVNRLAAFSGNLWWISPSGALQISNGANLNAAGIGGITGDYSGAGPMEFRYDTANTRYDAFANQSTNTWAYVRARAFDIAGGATSAFRARLSFAGTANVEYKLPAAAPAQTGAMSMVFGTNQIAVGQLNDGYMEWTSKVTPYGALHIYGNGIKAGAGVGAIALAANNPVHNLSLAGGTIQFECSALPTGQYGTPPEIVQVFWYGDTNGGSAPTLKLFAHDEGGTATEQTMTVTGTTIGAGADSVEYGTVPAVSLSGSSYTYYTIEITAVSNDLDTYSVAIVTDKA